MKRLFRSPREGQAAGLCAGLGRYLGVDPTVVRLSWVLGTLLTGLLPGVLAYLAGWLLVPEEPQPVRNAPLPPTAEP